MKGYCFKLQRRQWSISRSWFQSVLVLAASRRKNMIETKSPEDSRENVEELLAEPADSDSEHGESQRHRWREAFRRSFLGTPESRTPVTKRDLSRDRTRALMLLIGGVVGSVLLFLGIFSTPPARPGQVERGR